MKKVVIRWTAVYETIIEAPENATEHEIEEIAVGIKIDVPGSEYQQDTWEVMKSREGFVVVSPNKTLGKS